MNKSDEVNERCAEMSERRTKYRGDIEEGRRSRRKECGRCSWVMSEIVVPLQRSFQHTTSRAAPEVERERWRVREVEWTERETKRR